MYSPHANIILWSLCCICNTNLHCNRNIVHTIVFKYSVLEHRFMKVMVMMMVVVIIIIIKRMPLETKFSRSAYWQFERSSQYPLIMRLEVIGFKGYRMHFCGREGFRFPLLSYLQINVVHLVHSDCRQLLHITAQRRVCWRVFTFRLLALWNTEAQPTFCCFLFAPPVFLEKYVFFQLL